MVGEGTRETSDIRWMEEADRPGVESLYSKVFGEKALEAWRRRFEWQFLESPAAALRASRMWVAEREGEISGFLASFPARLKMPGGEVPVLCPCDLMVSSVARGEGLGERLVRQYISESGDLANALAYSPAAGRLYDRLGYAPVHAQPVMMRPLRGGRLLRSLLRRRWGSAEPPSLAWRVATPALAGGAVVVASVVNAVRTPRGGGGLRIEAHPSFDTSFDDLWADAAREIPVLFVRDAVTLRWRYDRDPSVRHTVFAARTTSGALAGYASACETTRHGVRVGKIMDVFCRPSQAERVVPGLMYELLAHFKEAGCDVLLTKGLCPAIRAQVRACLYAGQPGAELPARFLWVGESGSDSAPLYDADSWHLSHSDGDDDFVP